MSRDLFYLREDRISTPHTSRISPKRIAPALFQSYWFIAKINGAPIPPAPTSPRTDIDVKAVEDGGAECRSDLRENAVADGWNRVDTHGEERPVRAGIDGLQTFSEALCEKSDAADC